MKVKDIENKILDNMHNFVFRLIDNEQHRTMLLNLIYLSAYDIHEAIPDVNYPAKIINLDFDGRIGDLLEEKGVNFDDQSQNSCINYGFNQAINEFMKLNRRL